MIPKKELLKDILLTKVSPFLCRKLSVQACHSMSIIVAEILQKYGIRAEVQTCRSVFANEKWKKAMKERGEDWIAARIEDGTLPQDVWSVGIGFNTIGSGKGRKYEPYPIHAVVHLPDEGEIIDLAAHQADRPDHDLRVGPMWTKKDDPDPPMVSCDFVPQKSSPKIFGMDREEVRYLRTVVEGMILKWHQNREADDGDGSRSEESKHRGVSC